MDPDPRLQALEPCTQPYFSTFPPPLNVTRIPTPDPYYSPTPCNCRERRPCCDQSYLPACPDGHERHAVIQSSELRPGNGMDPSRLTDQPSLFNDPLPPVRHTNMYTCPQLASVAVTSMNDASGNNYCRRPQPIFLGERNTSAVDPGIIRDAVRPTPIYPPAIPNATQARHGPNAAEEARLLSKYHLSIEADRALTAAFRARKINAETVCRILMWRLRVEPMPFPAPDTEAYYFDDGRYNGFEYNAFPDEPFHTSLKRNASESEFDPTSHERLSPSAEHVDKRARLIAEIGDPFFYAPEARASLVQEGLLRGAQDTSLPFT